MATFSGLKCIKTIANMPNLRVGDVLYKVGTEIDPISGYEYANCRAVGGLTTYKIRIERLDECFELVDVAIDLQSLLHW